MLKVDYDNNSRLLSKYHEILQVLTNNMQDNNNGWNHLAALHACMVSPVLLCTEGYAQMDFSQTLNCELVCRLQQ